MVKLIILSVLLTLTSCQKIEESTDSIQKKQTEKMVAESNRRLGLPNITKFTEKRFQKLIYELKDKEVKTYSYFMDMNGKLHFLCNSIGYGVPASVQYVSPQKLAKASCGQHCNETSMPQPEPNGLFMPDSLDATYVLCVDKKGKLHPVYTEPKIIVSPFKLRAIDSLTR